MALAIEPGEGMVALHILDDIDNDDAEDVRTAEAPGSDNYTEALVAICVGVGKKVTFPKKGDTVFVPKYARHGFRIDSDTVLLEAYCVKARVSK